MKGRVVSWKDDKGFGFITPNEKDERVFFHLSSIKRGTRNPIVGDVVIFDIAGDANGRQKATNIVIEGVSFSNATQRIFTKKVRKDWLDYLCYGVLVISMIMAFALFVKAEQPRTALLPSAVFAIVLYYITFRIKKPENEMFSCGKCSSITSHDHRTIRAWNNGASKLYCRECNHGWHRDNAHKNNNKKYNHSPKSGCLGVFLVITLVPVALIAGIIKFVV